ncbi:MAG TPA: cytochrome b/b6 domain-containing protein [Anaeromyxobacteraceae bacterium]|nr:cytochrome b/b6 domain-containing protein [Anaeromyxobacteraceae bacterium]
MRTPKTLSALVLAAVPALSLAATPVNPIHPSFAPLDAAGKPAALAELVSSEKTCGACHDAAWIGGHSAHGKDRGAATCIQCHVDGGRLDVSAAALESSGRLRREGLRIGAPRAANCGSCHGVVSDGSAPVTLPPGLEAATAGGRTWSLTLGAGAIVAPQKMSASFLNLEGKEQLASPWDVHAAKLVDCVACHYARNDPARGEARQGKVPYVSNDPRRASTGEFLARPDHRLAKADCAGCHDASKSHGFLPYRERHMATVACQACHVQAPRGPVAEMVDATIVTRAGTPVVRWRNVERRAGEPLNAATITPFQPLLAIRTGSDGARRLTPVNLVTRYRWISRPTGAEVSAETLATALLEGGDYAPAVVETFDADHDGRLGDRELRLDSSHKTRLVAGRLAAAGVVDPVIDAVVESHPLTHGVSSREGALRDCDACHAGDSRLAQPFAVAPYVAGGIGPRPPSGGGLDLAGTLASTVGGGLELQRHAGTAPGGLHVLGHSRQARTNFLGFLLFAAVTVGVLAHGTVRWVMRRRAGVRPSAHLATEKEYVFGRYERLWHWTMAFSGIALIATGVQVHNPSWSWPVSLPVAVGLHNAFALVLIVNAGLALFHHLVTRAIRNFIPNPHGLLARALDHIEYQSRGIFNGDAHPHHPGHKLNPLQQFTYLGLLAVLFPLQIFSGLFIWAVGHWPSLGGLGVVAPIHNLGAWLFLTFFVMHTYLVTTGTRVGDHLRAMVTGYQTVPADAHEHTGA